jgi:beta-aspartyl-peptidase (threonine type)
MPGRHLAALSLLLLACSSQVDGEPAGESTFALVIHGGAGTIQRDSMSDEQEREYRGVLARALTTGHTILSDGGSSLDAVETVIRQLEDDPRFNAGKGAVFTAEGRNELDASIMDGSTTLAGAVAGVTRVRHPISAARAVMEHTEHVLLAGSGADAFAESRGLETVDPEYFYTERRWKSLERAREREKEENKKVSSATGERSHKFGTVGAVALDSRGRIAAGTSTGGMTNKRHGRIGDAPIIGAGTFANGECGVSATGHGEYFIRYAVAFDICARMQHAGATLDEAARTVIHEVLVEAGGSGGIIALDASGNTALVFNSDGMYRGYVLADGEPHVAIFKDE